MRIEDHALTLRRIPFQETSWVVSFLTPNYGAVSAVAKGIRVERGATRAALNGFHTLDIEIRARGAEAMGSLSRAEIVHARNRLPFMPIAAAAAQVMMEAVYRFVMPGDLQQGSVHRLLESALDALDAGMMPLAVVGGSLAHLLRLFGYGWRLDACIGCGGDAGLIYFSVRRGATVCRVCGAPYAKRLLVLNDSLRQTMVRMENPEGLGLLSATDLATLYHLGVARLVFTGGRSLATDLPFRRLAGVTSVVGIFVNFDKDLER